MKKGCLMLAFSFALLASLAAQSYLKPYTTDDYSEKGYFIGVGLKTNVFVNDNAIHDINVWKNPSLGGHIFAGKWFNPKWGTRILFEGGTLHPYFQSMNMKVEQKYVLGRLDFLLNLTSLLAPDNYHVYNLIPYAGVSGAYAYKAVNRPDKVTNFTTFMFGCGLSNSIDFSRSISGYLDLGMDFVDADFDGYKSDNRKLNVIASLSIGIMVNF